MLLLFLCPGTILAPSCQASCQASSSPPPSSGSVGAASSHPFSRSTTAPTPSCAVDPAPSPSKSGPETRLSPSAASRHAWLRTPRLAARVAAADLWVRTQVVLPQLSRSRFQTSRFLHRLLQRCHETVPELFSYPTRRFLHAWDWQRHHRCHRHGTHHVKGHRGTATEVGLGPLTSFPPSQGQSLGEPCGHLPTPPMVRPVGCTPITLYCKCQ
jgi:hypothetical protein